MQLSTFSKVSQNLFYTLTLPILIGCGMYIYFFSDNWNWISWLQCFVLFVLGHIVLYLNITNMSPIYLYRTYMKNRQCKRVRMLNFKAQVGLETSIKEGNKEKHYQQLVTAIIQKSLALQQKHNERSKGITSTKISTLEQYINKQIKNHQTNENKNQQKFQQQNTKTTEKNNIFTKPTTTIITKQQHDHDHDDYQIQNQSKQSKLNIKLKQHQKELYQKSLNTKHRQFKKTQHDLGINSDYLYKLCSQVKQITKQKIKENIELQEQNLQKLTNIVSSNFFVRFNSFKAKNKNNHNNSNIEDHNHYQSFQLSKITNNNNNNNQQSYKMNSKMFNNTITNNNNNNNKNYFFYNQLQPQPQSQQQLNKKLISFEQMLNQIFKLLKTKYIDYQYFGSQQNYYKVIEEIKELLKQRQRLDKFLALKLTNKGQDYQNVLASMVRNSQPQSQFEDERYRNLMRLRQLSIILQKKPQAAQQKFLKEYFKRDIQIFSDSLSSSTTTTNQQLLIKFMTQMFNESLKQINCEQSCKVSLMHPNFYNSNLTNIWIKRLNCIDPHYNVVYSFKENKNQSSVQRQKRQLMEKNSLLLLRSKVYQQQQRQNSNQRQQQQIDRYQELACIPGHNNVWCCLTFVRMVITQTDLQPKVASGSVMEDIMRLHQLLKN